MAFDSTIGGSSSNSYISVSDADSYFSDRGDPSDWTGATTAEKQAALIYATTYLDDHFDWYALIADTDQALGWPRSSYLDSEGRTIGGEGIIPQKIQDATCELALQHIQNNLNSTEGENIVSESIGDASVKYRGTAATKSFSFIKMTLRDYGTAGNAKSNTVYRA